MTAFNAVRRRGNFYDCLDWFTPGAGCSRRVNMPTGSALVRNARQKRDKQAPIQKAWVAFTEGLARLVGLACEHLPHLYIEKSSWKPEARLAPRKAEPAPGNVTRNYEA